MKTLNTLFALTLAATMISCGSDDKSTALQVTKTGTFAQVRVDEAEKVTFKAEKNKVWKLKGPQQYVFQVETVAVDPTSSLGTLEVQIFKKVGIRGFHESHFDKDDKLVLKPEHATVNQDGTVIYKSDFHDGKLSFEIAPNGKAKASFLRSGMYVYRNYNIAASGVLTKKSIPITGDLNRNVDHYRSFARGPGK